MSAGARASDDRSARGKVRQSLHGSRSGNRCGVRREPSAPHVHVFTASEKRPGFAREKRTTPFPLYLTILECSRASRVPSRCSAAPPPLTRAVPSKSKRLQGNGVDCRRYDTSTPGAFSETPSYSEDRQVGARQSGSTGGPLLASRSGPFLASGEVNLNAPRLRLVTLVACARISTTNCTPPRRIARSIRFCSFSSATAGACARIASSPTALAC